MHFQTPLPIAVLMGQHEDHLCNNDTSPLKCRMLVLNWYNSVDRQTNLYDHAVSSTFINYAYLEEEVELLRV